MIKRKQYTEKILRFIDKPVIKVITGIRRSGKTTLLLLLKDELKERGIPEDHIILINFESFRYYEIKTAEGLYAFLEKRIKDRERYYVLLDEIQEVKDWEKAINAFAVDFHCDITITGSNSHLLSSEMATYLAGRYVEIPVYTLSFKEFLHFREVYDSDVVLNPKKEFEKYLRLGGFPMLHTLEYSVETAWKVISDIYASVLLRDTIQRYGIRNVELLERVVRFIFNNIGNKFSAKKIADYFKSQQRRIDLNTVYNYLNALESAFLITRVPRYNISGKEILKTFEKYFTADHALIYAMFGYKDRLISGILENIILMEFKRRGYKVFVGKFNDKEVDFIAEGNHGKIYIQVSYKIAEQNTMEREYGPLLKIKDHYPKYVITMDDLWQDNIEGIKNMHIADFLLSDLY